MKHSFVKHTVGWMLAMCLFLLVPSLTSHAQCYSCKPHGAIQSLSVTVDSATATIDNEATLGYPVTVGTYQTVNVSASLYSGAKGPISVSCYTEGAKSGTVFSGSISGTYGSASFDWVPTVSGSYEFYCTVIAYANSGQNSAGSQPIYITVDD